MRIYVLDSKTRLYTTIISMSEENEKLRNELIEIYDSFYQSGKKNVNKFLFYIFQRDQKLLV